MSEEPKTVDIKLSKLELQILLNAIRTTAPHRTLESFHFELYDKLMLKLNEFK